jgi:hypothetical protein
MAREVANVWPRLRIDDDAGARTGRIGLTGRSKVLIVLLASSMVIAAPGARLAAERSTPDIYRSRTRADVTIRELIGFDPIRKSVSENRSPKTGERRYRK